MKHHEVNMVLYTGRNNNNKKTFTLGLSVCGQYRMKQGNCLKYVLETVCSCVRERKSTRYAVTVIINWKKTGYH